jgi:hypothetical protein
MTLLTPTPEGRHRARAWGSLGGLRFAARNDVGAATAHARAAQIAGYATGHGCKFCPTEVIPEDLPVAERQRRSLALRKAHMKALALKRHGL